MRRRLPTLLLVVAISLGFLTASGEGSAPEQGSGAVDFTITGQRG